MSPVQTLVQPTKIVEYRIKSSRFFGGILAVHRRADIDAVLQQLKATYPDANHICYAYRLAGRGTAITDFATDAGEPGGSAGTPILNVLRQSDLVDTAAWVVRYFGGTKLGIPGLIDAYSHTARLAMEDAKFVPWVATETVSLELPYAYVDKIKAETHKCGGKVVGEVYDVAVELVVSIPVANANNFVAELLEIGNGQVKLLSPTIDCGDSRG